MSLSHPPCNRRSEHGITLVETLVAISAGLIVMFATFSILGVSLTQSSRIVERVSADQRGRLTMEKIIQELHSSCVAPNVTPVEPGSEANKLRIVSQTGSEASFAKVTLHSLSFAEEEKGRGELIDTSYLNTGAKPAPNWEFAETPASTQILLTNVFRAKNGKGEQIPVFQYYKYEGSVLSKTAVSKLPLSEADAEATAAITVSFTATPESGSSGKPAGGQTVDLTDTAVLRFSPASSSGTNLPCA